MLILSYKEKTMKKEQMTLSIMGLKQLQEEEGGGCKAQWTLQ